MGPLDLEPSRKLTGKHPAAFQNVANPPMTLNNLVLSSSCSTSAAWMTPQEKMKPRKWKAMVNVPFEVDRGRGPGKGDCVSQGGLKVPDEERVLTSDDDPSKASINRSSFHMISIPIHNRIPIHPHTASQLPLSLFPNPCFRPAQNRSSSEPFPSFYRTCRRTSSESIPLCRSNS